MPHEVLLHKLEETDPELVEDVRGGDEFHDVADDYNDYARAEIIDRTPDAPYLESDQTRRDPALSRSVLNLRYNGTRGSRPELPRHPELFYGFMDHDPRGANDDPRFDQMRGQLTTRATNLAVSMGDNAESQIAERPWTGQSLSYAMKEVHKRVRANTRIFSTQKEGRPWARNVATDEFAASDLRAAAMDTGFESLTGGERHERFTGGDHGPAEDMATGGVRGVDGGHAGGADVAPWRHTTGDAPLGVQQYGQKRGAGRSTIGAAAQGGARLANIDTEHDWGAQQHARGANRNTLGATMAAAARRNHAMRSGRAEQDPGVSYEAMGAGTGLLPSADASRQWRSQRTEHSAGASHEASRGLGAGLVQPSDVARLYRSQREDQARRPLSEIQDGEGGSLGPAAGLTPASRPGLATRSTEAAVSGAHLANAEAIVAGLREGTASGRRRIAGLVVADGARLGALAEGEAGARRGLAPASDYGKAASLADAALQRSGAAGLEVHAYKSAPPGLNKTAALGREAFDPMSWHAQREAPPVGRSRAPSDWHSAAQAQHSLADRPDQVFGFTTVDAGAHGAAPTGPKSLRPTSWGGALADDGGLVDGLDEFSGDGVGLGDA
jgi:hypothetical protein